MNMLRQTSFGSVIPEPFRTAAGWEVPLGITSQTVLVDPSDPESESITIYSAYVVTSPTLFAHDIENALVLAGEDPAVYADDIAEAVEFGTPPDWVGFNTAMVLDSARNAYDIAIKDTHPTLSSKLDLAYSVIDTKGYDNFASLYAVFCSVAAVTSQDKQVWADLALTYHLPKKFINILLA